MPPLPRVARSPKSFTLPALCVIALIGIVLAVERLPTAGLEGYQARARPELILGQDKITQRNAAFLREGLLRMSPTFCEPEMLAANSAAAWELYGQACPAPDAARLNGAAPPSTALLPPVEMMAPEGVTVVSIVCRNDHLFSPEYGIVINPEDTGRSSERPAWLSARLGSKLLLESPIGLRIHGGHSRTRPFKSFSLVFREQYGGHEKCPAGLFFGPDTPGASHIVLMNADHPSRFNGALATEIAGLLGCKTSRSTPAVVYLNGTLIKSPFFLYQHQSPELVQQRYGIEEMDWVRLKANHDRDNPTYVKWRQWIRKNRITRSMQEEADHYDLADLSSWALAMSFTSTTDTNQGGYFRDRNRPKAVWQSFTWDLDLAFNEEQNPAADRAVTYADDSFKVLIGDRGRLFFRLMEQSPEYRESFENFAREALGSTVPRDTLMAMADRYLHLARTHPAADPELVRVMEDTKEFLSSRHDKFLPYLERQLREAESAGARLEAASGN